MLGLLVISSIGLTACSGSQAATPNPILTTTSAADKPAGNGSSNVSGLTWNDMPLYSGASQMQSGTYAVPAIQGEYNKTEWRYYETKDTPDQVGAFYKGQMTSKGWTEQGWAEAPGTKWGSYTKNNENDVAAVWISSMGTKTIFGLLRGSK